MTNQEALDYLNRFTPLGTQTLSKHPSRFPANFPRTLSHGKDAYVWDMEGNEYIDTISGLGAVSVGYSNRDINRVVMEQVYRGVSFSLPTILEAYVASRLCELVPHTDMWKFGKNGTDGTVMAVRAARAYTGRDKVMSVGYNGCADVFEVINTRNAGIPKALAKHITKAVYNDLESFKDLFTKEYACVIMEPMVYEYPITGFLEYLRYMCSETGTVLIFDEVVCGGRFDKFVAQSYFKVVPDLTVLSKGIANGFPLSAVGGKRSIMGTFERDDFFASGTFGGEAVSLAACLATVGILHGEISSMVHKGQKLQEHFNEVFTGLAKTKGYPTRFVMEFPTDAHKAVFQQEMCKVGVLIGACVMISASFTEQDVEQICLRMEDVYTIMAPKWDEIETLLEGALPTPVFKVR